MSLWTLLPTAAESQAPPDGLLTFVLHHAADPGLNLNPETIMDLAGICKEYTAELRQIHLAMLQDAGVMETLLWGAEELAPQQITQLDAAIGRRRQRFGALETLYRDRVLQARELLDADQLTRLAVLRQEQAQENISGIVSALADDASG